MKGYKGFERYLKKTTYFKDKDKVGFMGGNIIMAYAHPETYFKKI